MRRIIGQIIIFILFLFLTVFASVYFEDNGNEQDGQDPKRSIAWMAETVRRTGNFLDSFAGLSESGVSSSVSDSSVDTMAGRLENSAISLVDFTDNQRDINLFTKTENSSDFNVFLSNLLQKAPSLYIDTKIYSNGWRNFWSIFQREYRDLAPE
jgi:hypothetical protein